MRPSASGTPLSAYIGEMQKLLDDLEARELRAAWVPIDQYRKDHPNLEPLGDAIPKRGDKQETVAFFTFRGENVFGTNSGAFIDDKENDLGNEVFKFMKAQGLLGNAKAYGGGDASFLTHAEAQSLMKAWKLAGVSESGAKVMPTNIVMYVDRETCDFCIKGLPHLLYFMGIQVLTIYAKNNAKLQCTPSSDPNPKGNCVELRRANS